VNVEQYEYTRGPRNAIGLKLLLHQQDDVPLVQDFGDNVPVGMHSFVGVSVSKVRIALLTNQLTVNDTQMNLKNKLNICLHNLDICEYISTWC